MFPFSLQWSTRMVFTVVPDLTCSLIVIVTVSRSQLRPKHTCPYGNIRHKRNYKFFSSSFLDFFHVMIQTKFFSSVFFFSSYLFPPPSPPFFFFFFRFLSFLTAQKNRVGQVAVCRGFFFLFFFKFGLSETCLILLWILESILETPADPGCVFSTISPSRMSYLRHTKDQRV